MGKRANIQKGYLLVALGLALVPLLRFVPVSAAQLTERSVQVSDPKVSANTTHLFTFDIPSVSNVASMVFEYCENSPLPSEACNVPSGLDVDNASIDFQSGETGFGVHASSTPNRLILTRVASVTSPGTVQYVLSNITNQDFAGTVYVRISSHAASDGSGAAIDQGSVAYSTVGTLTTTAFVPPILVFCVGISVSANCSQASGSFIDLGEFSAQAASTGISQYAGATNDPDGYTVSIYGTTLTSGNNVIPALVNPAPSNPGSGQFGINLRNNTNPDAGADISGSGSSAPAAGYGNLNMFKFVSGDVLSQSIISTEFNVMTVSYMANVPPDQPAGIYSSTFTYVATATF